MNHSLNELKEIVGKEIKRFDKELTIWTERYIEGEFEGGKKYDAEQSAMVKRQVDYSIDMLSVYYDFEEVLNDKLTESEDKNKCDD